MLVRNPAQSRVAVHSGRGGKPFRGARYYQRFVEVDTDGSGMINYEEFLQVRGAELGATAP